MHKCTNKDGNNQVGDSLKNFLMEKFYYQCYILERIFIRQEG
jgi:hypothetical protein